MSDQVTIAIIAACATIPTSLAAIVGAYFSYRAVVVSKKTQEIAKKTEQNTNGMTAALVSLTAKSSHAEGVLEGEKNIQDKQ